jgi:hypothetical protein
MLAQVFTPAVAVWSKEIAIRRTASEEWSPIPFYGQFGWLNFVVVLDILAVYCVWCLFQHAYQFVVGQNYKGNLYYHIVITGCTTSCIATINGVSSQFYEFAICMTSVDKGGPHCLDATGKRDNLNPVNAVQVRREEGGRGRQGRREEGSGEEGRGEERRGEEGRGEERRGEERRREERRREERRREEGGGDERRGEEGSGEELRDYTLMSTHAIASRIHTMHHSFLAHAQLLDWTVCAFAVGGLLSWALVLKDLKRMHSKYPGAPAGGVHEQESARKMCRDMMCMYGCAVLITIVPLPLILYGKVRRVYPRTAVVYPRTVQLCILELQSVSSNCRVYPRTAVVCPRTVQLCILELQSCVLELQSCVLELCSCVSSNCRVYPRTVECILGL